MKLPFARWAHPRAARAAVAIMVFAATSAIVWSGSSSQAGAATVAKGCFNVRTGVLRAISDGQSCTFPEILVQWLVVQGPAGPQGPPGPQGRPERPA